MTEHTDHMEESLFVPEVAAAQPVPQELFEVLASVIEGVHYLNPERAAQMDLFLGEAGFREERAGLLNGLRTWDALLDKELNADALAAYCETAAAEEQDRYQQQLKAILESSRKLECMYRSLHAFFENTEKDRVPNVTFLNAGLEQLRDTDAPKFIDFVREEFKKNYDRLDLRDHYSLLAIPGYLGSRSVIEVWAKLAHEHKVMLITDFEHLDAPDDVMELFERVQHAGGEKFLSSVMMTCNWLVARGHYAAAGEEEALFMPPSAALAGKLYTTLMSQVAAGKKFGVLRGVNGVAFELKKSEIAHLEKMSLIPMVKDQGHVMAFSAKTLFNGDNMGLQTYSVVRVFDYVTKVLIDFLNRRAFENFNANTRRELMTQIVLFLDNISGPRKLVENFTIRRFEQDAVKKDNIHLDIYMKPYFPAKNFLIKMEGQKNEEGKTWDTDYDDS
ncbi:MAG: type VI secretion system contractile sheath protein TssC [Niabella sp.]|nr:type VI secretion system contractile sheath protein TssC [Niabella sp.]